MIPDHLFSGNFIKSGELSHSPSVSDDSILWRADWRNARTEFKWLDFSSIWNTSPKILLEGTFGNGLFAQIIDHPSVTWLDKFILANVFISNSENDHFTVIFSDDIDCRAKTSSSGSSGGLPIGDFSENHQKAFIVFDASQENNSFPRWGQWT